MNTDGKIQHKILVIDDDAEQAMSIKALLDSQGYSVNVANDKTSGFQEIKTREPDLIILDVMMEGRHDGFEMARDLKSDPNHKDTPIMIFTAIKEKTGTDFKPQAGDPSWLPVEGYLDKTVGPDLFIAEVERLLAK